MAGNLKAKTEGLLQGLFFLLGLYVTGFSALIFLFEPTILFKLIVKAGFDAFPLVISLFGFFCFISLLMEVIQKIFFPEAHARFHTATKTHILGKPILIILTTGIGFLCTWFFIFGSLEMMKSPGPYFTGNFVLLILSIFFGVHSFLISWKTIRHKNTPKVDS